MPKRNSKPKDPLPVQVEFTDGQSLRWQVQPRQPLVRLGRICFRPGTGPAGLASRPAGEMAPPEPLASSDAAQVMLWCLAPRPLPGPLAMAPSAMQHRVHSIFVHDAAKVTDPKLDRGPNRLETLLFPAKNVVRDPAETLGEHGHVPLHVLGTLMLARRAIRDTLNELGL